MRKHQKYGPVFDSLESREVLSQVGIAATMRAQAIMAMHVRAEQQAELRAERLAALRAAQAPRMANFAPAQVSPTMVVPAANTRAALLAARNGNVANAPLVRLNSSGVLRQSFVAPNASLTNVPGFVKPRIPIINAFAGGTRGRFLVNSTTALQGPTALVGNIRVPIVTPTTTTTTLVSIPGTTVTIPTGNVSSTIPTTTNGTSLVAAGTSVPFRNGLPVTTSANTANTFANTSSAIQFPNGFPNTSGLNQTNTLSTLSPTIQFPDGFPITTGLNGLSSFASTSPVSFATANPAMVTLNGLTVLS